MSLYTLHHVSLSPTVLIGRPVVWLFLLISVLLCVETQAQQRPTSRVDQLSDEQVQEFYRRAQASGLNELQIEQAAMSQGYTLDDIAKMRRRIAQIRTQTGRNSGQTTSDTGYVRTLPGDLSRRMIDSLPTFSRADTVKKPVVFGASLFQNAGLSFEPNLRIATPRNYVVGPDDEINIDIYGASFDNLKLRVSPEGTVKVQNLPPIFVSGLTIEQAEKRIIGRLQQIYQGIGRAGSGTSANVSLGNIRSIRVTLLGEVVRPGTYTISSLGSAFNALYLAGGPNPETGSFRKISVIRGNRVIRTIDLYDFLLRADQRDNIRLADQDVIRVADYDTRVEFIGQVRRPAIYEVLPGETLKTVLGFTGGFTDEAYTASLTLRRNTPRERKIVTITQDELAAFVPQRGDRYTVGKILERYENRVQITGAVMRPGDYALVPGLSTVKDLITRAEGLRKDAFTNRAVIYRERANMDMEAIAFDPGRVMQGQATDLPLQRQDSVVVQSVRDLRERYYVTIEGAVNKPDTFQYVNNLSVADLIVQAGGFQEGATASRIEVARRIRQDSAGVNSRDNIEIFRLTLDRNLGLTTSGTPNAPTPAEFILQPFDIVYIRTSPYYEVQQRVFITGEVNNPGSYAIFSRTERIADLINRSGGLKAQAYLPGAQFRRSGQLVATDLRKVLKDTTVESNLLLQNGDSLFIPRVSEIVLVQGGVLNPTAVSFEKDFDFEDYVAQAGGFTENARRKKSYVVYPNGRKDRTRHFLFANLRPKVEPGSTIVVPFRPLDGNRLSPAERIGILSVITTLAATILTVIRLL